LKTVQPKAPAIGTLHLLALLLGGLAAPASASSLIEGETTFIMEVTASVEADPCASGTIGATCSDGAIYAGNNQAGLRVYVAATEEAGTYPWRTAQVSTTSSSSLGDGFSNTASALAQSEDHLAAARCREKGSEWYLPSFNELSLIKGNMTALASAGFVANSVLWASSGDGIQARYRNLGASTVQGIGPTTVLRPVLCVRTDVNLPAGAPSAFSIPGRSVVAGDPATSTPVTITGLQSLSPIEISVVGEGTPEISVSGGNFSTQSVISLGESFVVRLTSSADVGTTHTATVMVAGVSSTFIVTSIADCRTEPLGAICADGAVYAGTNSAGLRIYVAGAEASSLRWKIDTTSTTGTTSETSGRANTNGIITAGVASHPAGAACAARGEDWFLPSMDELTRLYNNRNSLTAAAAFPVTTTTAFWSSTQSGTGSAKNRRMDTSSTGTSTKTTFLRVLCIRY
jgi:hypothetical protein